MSAPILRLDRVSVRWSPGADPVVREATLELDAGERLGLVGASGSGKSTLALAVGGLLGPRAVVDGSIRIGGDEVIGASRAALTRLRGRRVGFVFQDPVGALNPVRTVRSHFDELLDGADRGRAGALLEEVGLQDSPRVLAAHPHELSGGMAQRVAIALALARDPELLVADEPTTALDTVTQAGIVRLFERISEERGIGLLFISHDLPVVAGLCTRIAVLSRGCVVEVAPTGEIVRAPASEAARSLVEAADRFALEHGGAE